MKKILFILDHLKGGGAERIALELATELHNRAYQVHIALLDCDDIKMPIPKGIFQYHLNVDKRFFKGGLWRNRRKKLSQKQQQDILALINQIQADKIILSHWHALTLSYFLPRELDIALWLHGDVFYSPIRKKPSNPFLWLKEYRRWYLGNKYFSLCCHSRRVIVVNHDLQELYYTTTCKKITCVPNGIDIGRVCQGITQGKKQWDCIFVGRLGAEKQANHAIMAFAKSGLTGKMAIVGDGYEKESLQTLCGELGVEDRVDFLGWQENVSPFIVQSKCLVLSSKTEGSPLVILESLVLGTPVVAYAINQGVIHQLNHADFGRGLVESQNIDQLAKKLFEIANDPYQIAKHDKERYSIQTMATNFMQALTED